MLILSAVVLAAANGGMATDPARAVVRRTPATMDATVLRVVEPESRETDDKQNRHQHLSLWEEEPTLDGSTSFGNDKLAQEDPTPAPAAGGSNSTDSNSTDTNTTAPTMAPSNSTDNSNSTNTTAPSNSTTAAPTVAPTNSTDGNTTTAPTMAPTNNQTNGTTPAPTPSPTKKYIPPDDNKTTAPTLAPTTEPPRDAGFSFFRMLGKMVAWCILLALAVLVYGWGMNNRVYIAYYARHARHGCSSCYYWLLQKIRPNNYGGYHALYPHNDATSLSTGLLDTPGAGDPNEGFVLGSSVNQNYPQWG
jgi:hypothetical protein